MEWVELLNELSGHPASLSSSTVFAPSNHYHYVNQGFHHYHPSLHRFRTASHSPVRQPFRLRDLPPSRKPPFPKEVRFAEEDSYAFVVLEDEDAEKEEEEEENTSAAIDEEKLSQRIRYEWWTNGGNHCVTVTFLAPEPASIYEPPITADNGRAAPPFCRPLSSPTRVPRRKLPLRNISTKDFFRGCELTPAPGVNAFKRCSVIKITLKPSSKHPSKGPVPKSLGMIPDCVLPTSLSNSPPVSKHVSGTALIVPFDPRNWETGSNSASGDDGTALDVEPSMDCFLARPNCSANIRAKVRQILGSSIAREFLSKRKKKPNPPIKIEQNFQFVSAPTISLLPKTSLATITPSKDRTGSTGALNGAGTRGSTSQTSSHNAVPLPSPHRLLPKLTVSGKPLKPPKPPRCLKQVESKTSIEKAHFQSERSAKGRSVSETNSEAQPAENVELKNAISSSSTSLSGNNETNTAEKGVDLIPCKANSNGDGHTLLNENPQKKRSLRSNIPLPLRKTSTAILSISPVSSVLYTNTNSPSTPSLKKGRSMRGRIAPLRPLTSKERKMEQCQNVIGIPNGVHNTMKKNLKTTNRSQYGNHSKCRAVQIMAKKNTESKDNMNSLRKPQNTMIRGVPSEITNSCNEIGNIHPKRIGADTSRRSKRIHKQTMAKIVDETTEAIQNRLEKPQSGKKSDLAFLPEVTYSKKTMRLPIVGCSKKDERCISSKLDSAEIFVPPNWKENMITPPLSYVSSSPTSTPILTISKSSVLPENQQTPVGFTDETRPPIIISAVPKEPANFETSSSSPSTYTLSSSDLDEPQDVAPPTPALNDGYNPFRDDTCRGRSPLDEEKTSHAPFFEDDDLSSISVKKLKASYLSVTEQNHQTKKSSSPNSTPVRPRTPISQLVEVYSPPPPPSSVSSSTKGSHNHHKMNCAPSTSMYPSDFTPGISLQSLREVYCNVVRASPQKTSTTPRSLTPSKNGVEKLYPTHWMRNLEPTQVSSECRICGKQVFQMEKIVAEKASWHKNCFRCKECNKNLTLETYQSHEGMLYCKPHFKELFRPKAVVQDEAEERKDRLMRRPRMIILESQPEALPDDVVRATDKPDYGLEELQQTLNVKQRFSMFENMTKESEKPKTEPISVRRSQSLMSKAARFLDGHDDKGDIDGEYDEEEMEEEEEAEEEEEEEEEEEGDENEASHIVRSNRRKKERPMSFSGMGDLKAVWEQKQRREEMSQSRKEEIAKFRQMLCAGKNSLLKEKFESGIFDEDVEDDEEGGKRRQPKEQIKIEGKRAASNLMKKFERGEPFILEDEEDDGEEYEEDEYEEGEEEDGTPLRRRKRRETLCSEKKEVEEIFKEAETAKKARNVFKQIDSHVAQEGGGPILRSQSFATAATLENRRSLDASLLMHQSNPTPENVEVVKSGEKDEEYQVDTTDLASRFRFFLDYEKNKEKERETKRKVFRITPPREGTDQVLQDVALTKANMPKPCMAVNCAVCKLIRGMQGSEDLEVLGRDPNLIKCTDNYQDEVDCRNTKNILQMFRKMEMGNDDEEEEDEGPRPLKRFTPPPDAREYEDDSDYSDEYSDEEDEDDEEEEEEDEDGNRRPQIRDELLQMAAPPQSARKAASLRAKFERWEAEVERNNDLNSKEKEELEECMPSLDTAKNLRAMFEHKANEVVKPVASKPIAQKINRFV